MYLQNSLNVGCVKNEPWIKLNKISTEWVKSELILKAKPSNKNEAARRSCWRLASLVHLGDLNV